MKEDSILHNIGVGFDSSRRRGGCLFFSRGSLKDELAYGCPVPASLYETMVEEIHKVSEVLLVGILFEAPLH